MPRAKFENLPFELKLQIIEQEPYTLKTLIYVDRKLLQYINTEQGKTWLRRIAGVQIDTEYEKGILIFGTIKDGIWEYYTKTHGAHRLVKIEKYDIGNLYETIKYFPQSEELIIKEIIPMKDGIRDGLSMEYYLTPHTISMETLYENGKMKTLNRYQVRTGIIASTTEFTDDDTHITDAYNKDGTIYKNVSKSPGTLIVTMYNNIGLKEYYSETKEMNKLERTFYESGNIKEETNTHNYRLIDKNIYYDTPDHQIKENINYIPNSWSEQSSTDVVTHYNIDGTIAQKVYEHSSNISAREIYTNDIPSKPISYIDGQVYNN